MAQKSPLKLLIILLFVFAGIFFIAPHVPIRLNIFPKFFTDSTAYVFGRFGYFRKVAVNFAEWRKLSAENEELKKKNKDLISQLARLDILEEENDFLQRAIGIKEKHGDIVYAHVFSLNLGPRGYNVLINKGSTDGVSTGDIVITDTKDLVGIVEEVSKNSSRINFIFDTDFKITAKVMGKNTAGIARGAVTEGMYLDLISKEDDIQEGDSVISSGNDMFPSALFIGKVTYVEVSDSQMFKKVKLMPEIAGYDLGRVLVLRSNE